MTHDVWNVAKINNKKINKYFLKEFPFGKECISIYIVYVKERRHNVFINEKIIIFRVPNHLYN